jgi:hypothetical protein
LIDVTTLKLKRALAIHIKINAVGRKAGAAQFGLSFVIGFIDH